jgi:hypothetical protein
MGKRLLAEQALDNAILKEAASGKTASKYRFSAILVLAFVQRAIGTQSRAEAPRPAQKQRSR